VTGSTPVKTRVTDGSLPLKKLVSSEDNTPSLMEETSEYVRIKPLHWWIEASG
jgi:hypothetical protein